MGKMGWGLGLGMGMGLGLGLGWGWGCDPSKSRVTQPFTSVTAFYITSGLGLVGVDCTLGLGLVGVKCT